ncbi:MAG: NUDIX hydrolase [Candidatus Thalassarchaeaceae archaeon]
MRAITTDLGVAACIVKEERILLVKESRGSKAGLWGMPKGAVDEGEAPAKAVLRELREECGIEGEVIGLIGVRECVENKIPGMFLAYSVKINEDEIKIDHDEISDYGWFLLSEFEDIDWISEAMESIAISAIKGNVMEMTDYTKQKNNHYVVFS